MHVTGMLLLVAMLGDAQRTICISLKDGSRGLGYCWVGLAKTFPAIPECNWLCSTCAWITVVDDTAHHNDVCLLLDRRLIALPGALSVS
jgi:hypothetical protein